MTSTETHYNSSKTLEEKRKILKERAVKLAQERKENGNTQKSLEVVEFLLGNERFAIESTLIREVYPLKSLTTLPCVPSYIAGLINIRRCIVSVIDLKKIFDLPNDENQDFKKVIIIENESIEFAILVDAIVGMRSVKIEDLQTTLPTLTGVRQEFLKGITADQLVILDGNNMLNNDMFIVNEYFEN